MEATVAPKRSASRARPRIVQRVLKPLVWAGALVPLALLLLMAFLPNAGPWGRLGANPIEKITHWTGYTALVLLMVTLAVTPVRRLTGWNEVIKLRRLIGLFAFFYATLHFLIYMVLDQFFSLAAIGEDILERPYITVGFVAFVLLIPLAFTSTKKSIRRLGKRWQTLHRLVYVSAALGVLHFFWKVKADTREPLIFAAILAGLLVLRLPFFRNLRRSRVRSPS
jgi:sulfoxide reductase heme-binding subunit YedZ